MQDGGFVHGSTSLCLSSQLRVRTGLTTLACANEKLSRSVSVLVFLFVSSIIQNFMFDIQL